MCVNTTCGGCVDNCGCTCNSCTNNNCSSCCADPCENQNCGCPFEVSAACVRIDGNPLDCLGVTTGQTLEQALEAINNIVCDLSSGVDGVDGDSAYQIWINLGNTGTEQDFIDSLIGASGADGQGIDHTSFTSSSLGGGAGQAGATDTYTVWGDVAETINMGTFIVYNGTNGSAGANGANGTNGTNGQDGEFGGWSGEWIFDVATTPPSIAATELRFDDATLSSVTEIYINETNADSTNYSAFLDSFDNVSGGTNYYGLIRVWKRFDSNTFFYGKVTLTQDNGGYRTISVDHIQSNGTFVDTDNVVVSFTPAGIDGVSQIDTGWRDINDYTAPQGFGLPPYTTGSHPRIRVIGRTVFLEGLTTLPISTDPDTGLTLAPNVVAYPCNNKTHSKIYEGVDGGYSIPPVQPQGSIKTHSPIIPAILAPNTAHRIQLYQLSSRAIQDQDGTFSLILSNVFGSILLWTDGRLTVTTVRDGDDGANTACGGDDLNLVHTNLFHKMVSNVVAGEPAYDETNLTNTYNTATSGTLVVGQLYAISNFAAGDDFTNVGASSNASGVTFVATGTTPTVWANGSTLLSNYQYNVPTATTRLYPLTVDCEDPNHIGGFLVNLTTSYPIDETLTDAQVLAAWNSI